VRFISQSVVGESIQYVCWRRLPDIDEPITTSENREQ
jgi:hypothetical protein